MLYVDNQIFSDSLRTCTATPYRRLRGADYITGQHARRYWHLATVLPTLKAAEFRMVPDLVNNTVLIPAAPLPRDPADVADRLQRWSNERWRNFQLENSVWGARAAQVQRRFAQVIADHLCTPSVMQKSEYLRRIILLDPAIMKHVFAGHALPADFTDYCIQFALRNVSANEPNQPSFHFKELYR